MAIPSYQTLVLPVLEQLSDGHLHSKSDLVAAMEDHFNLSAEERAQRNPSGPRTIDNRTGWAILDLTKALLATRTETGELRITERGRDLIKSAPPVINRRLLETYPEYKAWRENAGVSSDIDEATNEKVKVSGESAVHRVRAYIELCFPDPAVRRKCLLRLVESIRIAHEISPGSWSVSLRECLRLNVGPLQCLLLKPNQIDLVVDKRAFTEAVWSSLLSPQVLSIGGRGEAFKVIPTAYRYEVKADQIDDGLALLGHGHDALLRTAATMRTSTSYAYGHRQEIIDYLQSELGETIPSPSYKESSRADDPGGSTFLFQANPTLEEVSKAANTPAVQIAELEALIQAKRQIVLEGPPGSGKTFVADLLARYLTGNPLTGEHDQRIELIQFHQSYGYEDFVQGIRPLTDENGQISYRVQPGIFIQMCERARANPGKPFVLIIDEINRGNISRIFGELMMLLEYRERKARLPYGPCKGADDGFLSIPDNLYLIGTMNSTDRSLALIDYALRRRFYFYRLLPVVNGEAPVFDRWLQTQSMDDTVRQHRLSLFIALNRELERKKLPVDFQIGHSYFMQHDIHTEDGLDRVWKWGIVPLLQEYFHSARDAASVVADFDRQKLSGGTAAATPAEPRDGSEA